MHDDSANNDAVAKRRMEAMERFKRRFLDAVAREVPERLDEARRAVEKSKPDRDAE